MAFKPNLRKSEDEAHASGDTGIMALTVRQDTAAAIGGTDADYQPLITDANGRLHVLDANSAGIKTAVEALDNAISGSEMQVDIVSSAATTAGDVAHDAADSGNPVKVGGKAYNLDGTAPGTAVAEGDRANLITDVYGRLFVEVAHPNSNWANDNQSSAQTNTALVSAPGAGLSIYITDIVISNGATAGNVKLVEDTGGTPADLLGPYYFAVNGGMVAKLATPKKLTANKDLGYTSASVTTHTISIGYFIAP